MYTVYPEMSADTSVLPNLIRISGLTSRSAAASCRRARRSAAKPRVAVSNLCIAVVANAQVPRGLRRYHRS